MSKHPREEPAGVKQLKDYADLYAASKHYTSQSPLNPVQLFHLSAPIHPRYTLHGKEKRHDMPILKQLGHLRANEARRDDLMARGKDYERHLKRIERLKKSLEAKVFG